MLRLLKLFFGVTGTILVSYFCAALIGSLWPVNAQRTAPADAVTIFLHSNGIHTSFILPRDSAGVDPAILFTDIRLLKPDANGQVVPLGQGFPGPALQYPLIAVGWGDKDFFLNTPTWAEVSPKTALIAVAGSGSTLIHVDQLTGFPPSDIRKVQLSSQGYAKLIGFISGQLAGEFDGGLKAQSGYGPDDRFFATQSPHRYSAFYTCNNWIAEGLAIAGARVGRWTPFSSGVMWWF